MGEETAPTQTLDELREEISKKYFQLGLDVYELSMMDLRVKKGHEYLAELTKQIFELNKKLESLEPQAVESKE